MISVVIPLYEKESTIVTAVASVLGQTRPAAEVIVVDDGSTDAGPELVRRHFPTVTVLSQENRGEGPARNAGIDSAGSEWIALLDADDYWLPWHLEHLAEMISLFPDVRMVAGAFAPLLPGLSTPVVHLGRPSRIDYFRAAARNSGVIHSSTVAIHREAFERVGGFSNFLLGADLEMWARLALQVPVAASPATSAVYHLGIGVTSTAGRADGDAPPGAAPTELSAISPSAAVVVDALDTGDHLPPERSLRRYLDSRIAWAMRTRIAHGDLDGARALRALASSVAWPENAGPVATSYLPPAVVRSLLGAKRTIRRRPARGPS